MNWGEINPRLLANGMKKQGALRVLASSYLSNLFFDGPYESPDP
jgi:hypothetical protein